MFAPPFFILHVISIEIYFDERLILFKLTRLILLIDYMQDWTRQINVDLKVDIAR